MKDQWYCRVDGQQYGPFSWDQMRAMGTEGRLVAESYVRRDADQRWFPAGKIPGLLPAANASAAAPATSASATSPPATNAKAAAASDTTASSSATATATHNSLPPRTSTPPATGNGASESSSKKLKVARPVSASAKASTGEPPAPPPVIHGKSKSNGKASPPIPAAATEASPLGIVVAPPVAAQGMSSKSGKSSKPASKSSLATVAEKDANGLSPLLVGGVLCGVALVLVAIGGGVVAWQMSQQSGANAAANVAAKPAETKPPISDAELDAILGPVTIPEPVRPVQPTKPAEAPAAASAKSAPAAAPAEVKPAADPKIEASRKLIASQPRWTPVEGVVIKGRDIQVEIAQIWLATDETGTRVDPILPRSAPSTAGPVSPGILATATATASPGKYVFIDVRISNSGAIPRKYTSWNTGGTITAILADAKFEPLAFVPPDQTPLVPRQSSVHIPAGNTIGDVLVFRAPAEPFESLKLLLSQGAFATAGRNFALDVPVEFLFKRAEGLPPQTAIAADDAVPAEGEAQPLKKPVDPNAPPSLEDFTKQLENDKKMLDKRNATDDPAAKPET